MNYSLTPMSREEIVADLGQRTIDNLSDELEKRIGPCRADMLKGRPFQIAKEAWEYALADATEWNGGVWVGNGNNPEDVRVNNNHYDVKGLGGVWTSVSGEASVKQTLSAGARIDESFLSEDSENLWNGVIDPWLTKVTGNSNGQYKIAVFWRHRISLDVRLVMFKFDPRNIPKYSANHCRFNSTKTRMDVLNLADPDQAKLYILRSKHRMELRIKGSYFNDPDRYVDVYSFKKMVDK